MKVMVFITQLQLKNCLLNNYQKGDKILCLKQSK